MSESLKDIIEKRLNLNVVNRKDKGTKEGIRLLKKYINQIKLKYNNFYILK